MTLNRRDFLLTSAGVLVMAGQSISAAQSRPRLPRKDAFFGLHFDLHPNEQDKALGRDITEEMIERLLLKVKPDYVQYDCKGHPGYTGYPTKIGTPSPGIVGDSLAIWRKVTAAHGVALFIHYSGVWDQAAIKKHPEWARMRPDGARDERNTSTFGPYVDELLIPQLKEAAEKYDLDGAWVDGDCWAVQLDYSEASLKAFTQATGLTKLPRGPRDEGWQQFLELTREQFRRYVRRYVEALHRDRPGFQITSNWLYSTMVPEKPELPVDFLSGDYLGNAAISRARVEARYMTATGKPWDLMAWGFQMSGQQNVMNHKPAVQLEQEAAVVLAQSGGFQIYYVPSRSGVLDDRLVEVMARVARFCRARQPYCHRTEAVPQVGLLYSKHSAYTTSNRVFGGSEWGGAASPLRGMLDALLENHYSVDIVPDWRLEDGIKQYPLMVVPEWTNIGTAAKAALADYARNGGRLLLVGAENAGLFAEELGVRLAGAPSTQKTYVNGDEVFGEIGGLWQEVELVRARQIESRRDFGNNPRETRCAATVSEFGAGRVAGIYGPAGAAFAASHAPAIRQFVRRVTDQLFTPIFTLDAPPTVEAILRRKEGRLLLHLLNTTNMQIAGEYAAVDYVPAAGPIEVRVKMASPPKRATLEPEGRRLTGSWRNGVWSVRLERLELHGVVAIG